MCTCLVETNYFFFLPTKGMPFLVVLILAQSRMGCPATCLCPKTLRNFLRPTIDTGRRHCPPSVRLWGANCGVRRPRPASPGPTSCLHRTPPPPPLASKPRLSDSQAALLCGLHHFGTGFMGQYGFGGRGLSGVEVGRCVKPKDKVFFTKFLF